MRYLKLPSKDKFKRTKYHCYVGYIVQAIVNNLLPLFFVIFQKNYGIGSEKLSTLIIINFLIQLAVDVLATRFGDKVGFRASMIIAHFSAAAGLVAAAVLPLVMPNTFAALCIATLMFAVGGGLIEVVVSPIVDALTDEANGTAMAFLHSFYCWGQVGVVAVSTLLLLLFGNSRWYLLPLIWAVIPFFNAFPFMYLPMPEAVAESERVPLKSLFKNGKFIMLFMLMLTAGASELAMSQWASFFAECGLGVTKVMGDLLGPCAFAVLMGLARILYGIYGKQLDLQKTMLLSAVLCIVCYITAGLSRNPYLGLAGCAVCGFSVGLMWPGTLSLAGNTFNGGTAMFGVLAVAGDLGCSVGPWLTGIVSAAVAKSDTLLNLGNALGFDAQQSTIKLGLLAAAVFPVITVICIVSGRRKTDEKKRLS